jgi:hypothetical protein
MNTSSVRPTLVAGAKFDLEATEDDHRRVLAVIRFLDAR